jgi:KUP system potassium uptake protein
VVIVTIDQVSIPHVDDFDRFTVEELGGKFKVSHVSVRIGYHDRLDVPESLQLCRKQALLERNLDLEHASYFVSRITIAPTSAPPLKRLRKKLFIAMARRRPVQSTHFACRAIAR